MNHDDEDKFPN